MLKSIKVRDYMTRHLVTFRSDTDLFTAINRLLEHRISGAPVVDSQGHLIGLLETIQIERQRIGTNFVTHEEPTTLRIGMVTGLGDPAVIGGEKITDFGNDADAVRAGNDQSERAHN